jgi:hypothetical protein
VARQVAQLRVLQDGTSRTVLRLAPEHLGAITLTVEVRGRSVRLAVTGSDAAVTALREGLGDLQRSLRTEGLDLGNVHLAGEQGEAGVPDGGGPGAGQPGSAGAGGTGAGARQGGPPAAGTPSRVEPGAPRPASDTEGGARTGPPGTAAAGRLDVRV